MAQIVITGQGGNVDQQDLMNLLSAIKNATDTSGTIRLGDLCNALMGGHVSRMGSVVRSALEALGTRENEIIIKGNGVHAVDYRILTKDIPEFIAQFPGSNKFKIFFISQAFKKWDNLRGVLLLVYSRFIMGTLNTLSSVCSKTARKN